MPFVDASGGAAQTSTGGFLGSSGGSDPIKLIADVIADIKVEQDESRAKAEGRGRNYAGSPVTPVQVVANENDYDVGAFAVARLTTDASRNFTGFAGGQSSRSLLIINAGSFNVVITHQDVLSVAANRVITPDGLSKTLTPDDNCRLWYDSVDSRWRFLWGS